MGLYCEVWTRPGHASFGRLLEPPTFDFTLHDGVNLEGDGSLSIPESYGFFDDILTVDPTNPANYVSSLARVFDDSVSPPQWVFDWLPSKMLPVSSKDDPDVNVSGRGIKSILKHARTEAWDWDGSANFSPTFPDWIYGGTNLLSNPGFEDSTCRPEVNEIVIVQDPGPMTGSFFVTDGVDPAGPFDVTTVNASDLENDIEAQIAAIDDVNVTGTGTEADPFVITFITPCVFPGGLSVTEDPTDLWVDGYVDIDRTQFGALMPNPWTKSTTVSDGTPVVHGDYTSFRVTTAEAHTGTYSLLIDPATIGRRFAGAQQVVNVKSGGRYQASVWVKTNSASQQYRFVIRGVDEDLLLDVNGNPALLQLTLTSGVWTQFSIPDVDVGDNTQIILRIANINVSGNPAIFYVDDGEFNEGMAPTTVGDILTQLYLDATSDHAGRVVWEDEANPGTPYLTLDFDATTDSNGVAWLDSDLSIKIWMRFSYFQVMDMFARLGYEWRIVPDDIELGTYLWQVYNPGGMQTDYTAAVGPAIQGGSTDTRRSLDRFLPEATNWMVEALGRATARADSAALGTALGRIEGSKMDREMPTIDAAATAATEALVTTLIDGLSYDYELTNPGQPPLTSYQLGDLLTIHDPPLVNAPGRLADVEVTVSPTQTKYQVQFYPEGA